VTVPVSAGVKPEATRGKMALSNAIKEEVEAQLYE
jgi:hypothetical protein